MQPHSERENFLFEMRGAPQIRGHLGDIVMSIVEKQSPLRTVDLAAVDSEMSATTSICVALVVVLILYVLGTAVLQQDVV